MSAARNRSTSSAMTSARQFNGRKSSQVTLAALLPLYEQITNVFLRKANGYNRLCHLRYGSRPSDGSSFGERRIVESCY